MRDFRPSLLQIGAVLLLVVLAIELGGIWTELHHIRAEQVKNKYCSLPDQILSRIPDLAKKQWQSTTRVEVDGAVDVNVQDQPIQVEGNVSIDR